VLYFRFRVGFSRRHNSRSTTFSAASFSRADKLPILSLRAGFSRRHNALIRFFRGLFSRADKPFIFLPEPALAGGTKRTDQREPAVEPNFTNCSTWNICEISQSNLPSD